MDLLTSPRSSAAISHKVFHICACENYVQNISKKQIFQWPELDSSSKQGYGSGESTVGTLTYQSYL